jgi:hypothetical protein
VPTLFEQSLLHLLQHLDTQIERWTRKQPLTDIENLGDWEILLGRLHEKADDLTIWGDCSCTLR